MVRGGGEMSLRDDLIRDEGERLKPYLDTAVPPKTTIGVGRNLTDRGITHDEAMVLLDNDLVIIKDTLAQHCPWLDACPEAVQRGLGNMCFNVGWPRLSGFRNMLAALQAHDWEKAADEALNSTWAAQVPNRAHRIAMLFRGPHV